MTSDKLPRKSCRRTLPKQLSAIPTKSRSRRSKMESSSDPKAPKRRVGRKRQKPLPPGPPIQFVIANHPDEFRAGKTMRNVRSHVMYKHREQRGASPGKSKSAEGSSTSAMRTRTPSPQATQSDGGFEEGEFDTRFLAPTAVNNSSTAWDEDLYRFTSESPTSSPSRDLAIRIISAMTATPARSAPPMFEDATQFPFPGQQIADPSPLDALKQEYIGTTDLFCHDSSWMQRICDHHLSFLSHVSVACVYQDLREGLLYPSELTVLTSSKVMSILRNRLDTDDATILSVMHLLISELGGHDDEVFEYHASALIRLVSQRGGIGQLAPNLATTVTLVSLALAALRGAAEPPLVQTYTPQALSDAASDTNGPISPLYAPGGDLSPLYGHCSPATIELLSDMQDLTQIYLARFRHAGRATPDSISQVLAYDEQLKQILGRLQTRPSTEDDVLPDWKYESCRLAALIYAGSVVQGTSFTDAANTVYLPPASADPNFPRTTMLGALHAAVLRSDTYNSWGNMHGVFLWVCIVGGGAIWPCTRNIPLEQQIMVSPEQIWMRKCFALFTMKAALSVSWDQAPATIYALRTMLQIRHLMDMSANM